MKSINPKLRFENINKTDDNLSRVIKNVYREILITIINLERRDITDSIKIMREYYEKFVQIQQFMLNGQIS